MIPATVGSLHCQSGKSRRQSLGPGAEGPRAGAATFLFTCACVAVPDVWRGSCARGHEGPSRAHRCRRDAVSRPPRSSRCLGCGALGCGPALSSGGRGDELPLPVPPLRGVQRRPGARPSSLSLFRSLAAPRAPQATRSPARRPDAPALPATCRLTSRTPRPGRRRRSRSRMTRSCERAVAGASLASPLSFPSAVPDAHGELNPPLRAGGLSSTRGCRRRWRAMRWGR